jgi:hypothetical protein
VGYGRPWIQALNTGDARGTAYYETALPLQRPRQADLSRLPAAARRMFQSQYATMEITDSVALTGAHQVALVRNYSGKLQDATQELENDLVSTQAGTHELTASWTRLRQANCSAAARTLPPINCCLTRWSSCSHAANAFATQRPATSTCSC